MMIFCIAIIPIQNAKRHSVSIWIYLSFFQRQRLVLFPRRMKYVAGGLTIAKERSAKKNMSRQLRKRLTTCWTDRRRLDSICWSMENSKEMIWWSILGSILPDLHLHATAGCKATVPGRSSHLLFMEMFPVPTQ